MKRTVYLLEWLSATAIGLFLLPFFVLLATVLFVLRLDIEVMQTYWLIVDSLYDTVADSKARIYES